MSGTSEEVTINGESTGITGVTPELYLRLWCRFAFDLEREAMCVKSIRFNGKILCVPGILIVQLAYLCTGLQTSAPDFGYFLPSKPSWLVSTETLRHWFFHENFQSFVDNFLIPLNRWVPLIIFLGHDSWLLLLGFQVQKPYLLLFEAFLSEKKLALRQLWETRDALRTLLVTSRRLNVPLCHFLTTPKINR